MALIYTIDKLSTCEMWKHSIKTVNEYNLSHLEETETLKWDSVSQLRKVKIANELC